MRRPNSPTRLFIVCCHAVYNRRGADIVTKRADPYDEANWTLASFQKSTAEKEGEHRTFIHHLKAGIHALGDGDTAVVLSGSSTKEIHPHLSEAQSYLNAAHDLGFVEEGQNEHILLEEDATDCYQNILFSILKFRKTYGSYPSEVAVIIHAFKARRIMELHIPAIRWPSEDLPVGGKSARVVGIDPPFSEQDREDTERGEILHGYGAWKHDLYGVGDVLHQKRVQRRWDPAKLDAIGAGLEDGVKELLHWKGGDTGIEVFSGPLPWDC